MITRHRLFDDSIEMGTKRRCKLSRWRRVVRKVDDRIRNGVCQKNINFRRCGIGCCADSSKGARFMVLTSRRRNRRVCK